MNPLLTRLLALLCAALFPLASLAQVTSISAFTGSHSETWEEYPGNDLLNGTVIFQGLAAISGTNMVTDSQFQMCTVVGRPSDGVMLMDSDRPAGPFTVSFVEPVSAFGAYWGDGYRCSFGDAAIILTFKDASGNTIGSDSFVYQGNGTLLWRGYAFSTPVKTVIRTAGDGQEGFATDGMQAMATSALKVGSITRLNATSFRLQCRGVPNVVNRIEWSADLSPNSFTTLTSVAASNTGAFQYDDLSPGTRKFYRVAYP